MHADFLWLFSFYFKLADIFKVAFFPRIQYKLICQSRDFLLPKAIYSDIETAILPVLALTAKKPWGLPLVIL